MNTLERLKELNTTTGKRSADEDLGHWADREKHENMWVREVALPDLIAVVEAALGRQQYLTPEEERISFNKLDAALAKLEAPDEH